MRQLLLLLLGVVALVLTQVTPVAHAMRMERHVRLSNTTVILWAARFGFSAAGTLAFNATPDADTAAYRSNLTLLVCSERESRPILTASAAQLCTLSCASRCLHHNSTHTFTPPKHPQTHAHTHTLLFHTSLHLVHFFFCHTHTHTQTFWTRCPRRSVWRGTAARATCTTCSC